MAHNDELIKTFLKKFKDEIETELKKIVVPRCQAKTTGNKKCKHKAMDGAYVCKKHKDYIVEKRKNYCRSMVYHEHLPGVRMPNCVACQAKYPFVIKQLV